jgi:hypothetical protein
MMPCFANPITFAVLLVCGMLLVMGAILLGSSRRGRPPAARDPSACASCGHQNPQYARFCARCGNRIGSNDVSSN